MHTAALLLLLAVPADTPIRVTTLERNHVYDEHGVERLDQVIGWSDTGDDYHADWWHYSRDMHGLRKTPYGWRCSIKGKPVEARLYLETWTQFDREIADHDSYPTEWRGRHWESR